MPFAELSEDASTIWVQASFSDQDVLKLVPGMNWSSPYKMWHCPASFPACLILRDLFGENLIVGENLARWSWYWKNSSDWRMYLRDRLEPVSDAPGCWDYPDALYRFQQAGQQWLSPDIGTNGLLSDEQGTGKTVQLSAWMNARKARGDDVFPVLVVCPNSVKTVWKEIIEQWAPELLVTVVHGSATDRRKQLGAPADVFVINWESLRLHTRLAVFGDTRLARCAACGGGSNPETGASLVKETSCEAHNKELNLIPFRTVIADEAHRMQDGKSKQTRAMWWMLHHATYRWALTGTPAESSLADLWSILHGIDPVAFPTKSKFLDYFATTSFNFWGGFEVLGLKPEKQDLYYRITQPYIRRILKKDALPQLPDKVYVYRYPEMGPQQARAYHQMEKDMVAHLEELVAASNPLVQLARLSQFACASASAETDGVDAQGMPVQTITLHAPSCKVDDLLEFLSDEPKDKQVVVCARSKKLINLAAEALTKEKISFVLMTGDTTTDQRDGAVKIFQSRQCRVFLCTIDTAGEGITLTAADTIFFMQEHDSHRANSQMEDRVHRIGSEIHESIRVIKSITKDTVEERRREMQDVKGMRMEELVHNRAALRYLLTGE